METANRILTKEKLERQLAGQSTRASLFLTMKEENKQRHKMEVFGESYIIDAKIDKLTSLLGKVSTQNRQSKPFKPSVYQGRGQHLTNSGRRCQYYNKNRKRFYDKGRSYNKNRSCTRNNQNFRGMNNFRDDRNRGKYNKCDRRNVKNRYRSYDRGRVGLVRIEETVNLGIQVDPCLGIKVKR